jgi:hypothetical protein
MGARLRIRVEAMTGKGLQLRAALGVLPLDPRDAEIRRAKRLKA